MSGGINVERVEPFYEFQLIINPPGPVGTGSPAKKCYRYIMFINILYMYTYTFNRYIIDFKRPTVNLIYF